MKKKIFLMFIMIIIPINIRAIGNNCGYADISRLKSLVTNINISYDYKIIDNFAYFDVTINNITKDMYFIDTTTWNTYTYNDTINGEITIRNYSGSGGSYKFYSALSDCYGTSLGIKYYKFPTYNIYYESDLCNEVPNYSLCQKWANVTYSSDKFEQLVNEYKESLLVEEQPEEDAEYNKSILNQIIDFYINYYYYFLIAIIVICGVIILINRKKNKFNL